MLPLTLALEHFQEVLLSEEVCIARIPVMRWLFKFKFKFKIHEACILHARDRERECREVSHHHTGAVHGKNKVLFSKEFVMISRKGG